MGGGQARRSMFAHAMQHGMSGAYGENNEQVNLHRGRKPCDRANI